MASYGDVKNIKKIIIPIVIGLCSSPLIFVSMYFDYFYGNAYLYIIAIIFPVIFIRKFKELVLVFLLSCIVSGLLVSAYIPGTETFFKPFDKILEILVILEAIIFGIIQVLLLVLINVLKKSINTYRRR